MQAGRWSQAGGCKQSVRGRQRETQAVSLTRRNADRQELLSRHTSMPKTQKTRTGRHRGRQSGKYSQLRQLGRQKRWCSTVREVNTCTQKWGEGRGAGRQRLTERSKLEACK
jgi:hypothetical protein